MNRAVETMTRRQALARAAYLLGGTLSASTIAGVLAGCAAPAEAAEGAAWNPRTLSPEQSEMVLILGEQILPETDTPGARAARVDRFIDAMLTDYYSAEVRQRFLSGLERADARARRAFGKPLLELSPDQQLHLVRALNRAAFRAPGEEPGAAPTTDQLLREGKSELAHALAALNEGWVAEDVGRESFFRTLKELVVVGYYTSEVGATQELSPSPMGIWRADVPYAEIGQAWSF